MRTVIPKTVVIAPMTLIIVTSPIRGAENQTLFKNLKFAPKVIATPTRISEPPIVVLLKIV